MVQLGFAVSIEKPNAAQLHEILEKLGTPMPTTTQARSVSRRRRAEPVR